MKDPTEAEVVFGRVVQQLAELGQAPNQCPECKSYRLDGEPPYLHETGCSRTESRERSISRWVTKRKD